MTEAAYRAGDPSRLENLPVELRSEDFALIARATVSTVAATLRNVSDDNVYLSVTLPDGAKVGRMISCVDEPARSTEDIETMLAKLGSVSAFLHAEDAEAAHEADADVRHGISCTPIAGVEGTAFRGAALYRGTGMGAHDPLPLPGTAVAGLSFVRAKDAPAATVQIMPSTGDSANFVLPRGATIRVVADGEDWIAVSIATGITTADDIIRLRAGGQVDDVAALLRGLKATDAASWMETNPAAGVVLGYGLLRADTPEAMDAPFANALSRWPDDPDALIIAAEVAARLGRHEEAMATYQAAVKCGLPAYNFGLNYAADRLRAYGPRQGGPEITAELKTRLEAALHRVYPFANQQESSVLLTCYTGTNPTSPSVGHG